MDANDAETNRVTTPPGIGICAPALPFGLPGLQDALGRQGFSMRDAQYRLVGPPMERLMQRRKAVAQERDQLTDKLDKIDAAIKLLEAQPELSKTLDALAAVGVL